MSSSPLPVVWSRLHALHDPADREALIESALHRAAGETSEFALGEAETWVENPRRVDALLTRLRANAHVAVTEARRHSLEEGVLLVHNDTFVSWMRQFWAAWKAAGEPGRFGDGDTGLLPGEPEDHALPPTAAATGLLHPPAGQAHRQ